MVDLFVNTHPHADHCDGFDENFYTGDPDDYDDEDDKDKIVIGELWPTPMGLGNRIDTSAKPIFYAVPADNRDLNYDKYFKEGDVKRALIEEFNSNNTRILNLEETKEKIASLTYIQNELNEIPNLV